MKKIIAIIMGVVSLTSCMSDYDPKKIDLKNLDPYVTMVAPTEEGKLTVIRIDTSIIGRTDVAMEFLVPKGVQPTYEFIPQTKKYQNGGWFSYQQMACFEDTKNGDNDYNDFVAFITTIVTNDYSNWQNPTTNTTVYVQPIALGSSLDLQFGIRYPNGQIWMATDNIRRDFFKGKVGFINTDVDTYNKPNPNAYYTKDKNHIMRAPVITLPINTYSQNPRINPFIISGADTIYLAIYSHNLETTNYNNTIGGLGYPYGITFDGSFSYPYEKTNIIGAYEDFLPWVNGTKDKIRKNKNNPNKVHGRIEDFILYNPQYLSWN